MFPTSDLTLTTSQVSDAQLIIIITILNMSSFAGELDGNRHVPFRLTQNIAELITPMGVAGPFTNGMIATARCLCHPSFKVHAILRTILRDEIMSWYKKVRIGRHSFTFNLLIVPYSTSCSQWTNLHFHKPMIATKCQERESFSWLTKLWQVS